MNHTQNKKITIAQALLIYVIVIYAPNIRFILKSAAGHAHQAAWLTYLCSLVLYVPLLYMLYKITKKFEGVSFYDILCKVFGKGVGNVMSVLYMILFVMLLSMYIRYSGQLLVTSAFANTDINLLMFLIVLLIGITLRWGLQVLARMNKIISALVIAQFLIIIMFTMAYFSPKNITPVSGLDVVPILATIPDILAISGYITFMFTFNDQIQYGKKSGRKFFATTAFLVFVNTITLLAVLGMFGYELTNKLTFPFLMAVENISVFNASAGLESLFSSIWGIAEFVTLSFFAYCIVRYLKHIFHLKSETPVLTAVLAFALFMAMFICNDIFEFTVFSQEIMAPVNFIFGFGLPLALFVTAKIRKLL